MQLPTPASSSVRLGQRGVWQRRVGGDEGLGQGEKFLPLGHIRALREVVVAVLLDAVQDLAVQDQRRPSFANTKGFSNMGTSETHRQCKPGVYLQSTLSTCSLKQRALTREGGTRRALPKP